MHRKRIHVVSATERRINDDASDDCKPKIFMFGEWVWPVAFLLFAVICLVVIKDSTNYPKPLSVKEARHFQFCEERARTHLNAFANLGPRVVGSQQNEKKVVDYLFSKLRLIQDQVKPVHKMYIDVSDTSGTFTLQFLGEFSSVYRNLTNIVAKFGPRYGSSHSVMVNCHYDTVVESPGASDDAVSCSLMLEVLQVLSQDSKPLKHNIIFVFNGGEETVLQAGHGFITQHRWAKDIKAFVNLDSAGAGGKELVFQTGPGYPWLIRAYGASAKYPFAAVIAQEVFESGIIPSDTDYRIFRDYGNIPGIDIAYVANGYIYHTSYDTPDMIPPGCIQRGGDNLLSLLKHIANSPELEHTDHEKHGSMVFFDVLSKFMVMYPRRIGNIVNFTVVLVLFFSIGKKVLGRGKYSLSILTGTIYLRHILKAVAVQIISWLASFAAVTLVAMLICLMGRPMSWFTNVYNMIGLYVIPTFIVHICVHTVAKSNIYKAIGNPWQVEQLTFEANMLIFALLVTMMTIVGLGSAFLPMLWLLCPLVIREKMGSLLSIEFKKQRFIYMAVNLISQAFPALITFYLLYYIFVLFVPMMGRVGHALHPDLFISLMCAATGILIMLYQSSMVYITKSTRTIIGCLVLVFVVTVVCVLFTPLGFPYKYSQDSPSLQRHVIVHTNRNFRDVTGKVVKSASDIWWIPLDQYAVKTVSPYIPELSSAEVAECEGSYCGWPFLYPMLAIVHKNFKLPTKSFTRTNHPKLKLVDKLLMGKNLNRYIFDATGPDHMALTIELETGVNMTKWSMGNGVPHTTKMPLFVTKDNYYVMYAHGKTPATPWRFWIDVEDTQGRSEHIFSIALSGHYVQNNERLTPELSAVLSRMPDWTYPLAWCSTYDSWQF